MGRSSPHRNLFCKVCKEEAEKWVRINLDGFPHPRRAPFGYESITVVKRKGQAFICRCDRCKREYISTSRQAYRVMIFREAQEKKNHQNQ